MTYGTEGYGTTPYGVGLLGGGLGRGGQPYQRAFPTPHVYVSFTAPFATTVWTEITQYVDGITTSMGRQHELQQVNPSTASITLYNGPVGSSPGGMFSPWNTDSPYYHSGQGLVPARPVKITAEWNGVTYPVYYGYSKAWTPAYGLTRSTLTLTCYDILGLLNLNTLDTGQYSVFPIATAKAYYELSDPIGSSTAIDSTGHGYTGTAYGGITYGVAGPLLTEITTAASSAGLFINVPSSIGGSTISVGGWVKASADVTIYGKLVTGLSPDPWLTTGSGIPEFTIGTSTVAGTSNVCDGEWHYVVGVADGSHIYVYVDGVLQASATQTGSATAGTGAIAAGFGTFANIELYDIALTATQISDQYQLGSATWMVQDSGARINAVLQVAGIPAGYNNVGTGLIQCQGATSSLNTTTAMSYLNTVVNTERGFLFQDTSGVLQYRNREYVYTNTTSTTSQATFGYATGQLHFLSTGIVPLEDDTDLWNNIPVQRTNGVIQDAFDTTSITNYGRRTLTGYTNLLFTNDNDSADLAAGLLYQYKNPTARVRSLTTNSTISAGANLPQMLGRQLLDRITINWRPLDGSNVDFSQQSLIEQISHTVTPEVWTTTFAVTPIGTENFFIVGSSLVGGPDPVGF